MAGLTSDDLRHVENRLRDRHAELLDILRANLVASKQEQYGDIAGEVHDDVGDRSVAELERDMSFSERQREFEELRDVEAALERVRIGSYGVCIECGADMPRERLGVFPTAKRCVDCQQRDEASRRRRNDMTPSL